MHGYVCLRVLVGWLVMCRVARLDQLPVPMARAQLVGERLTLYCATAHGCIILVYAAEVLLYSLVIPCAAATSEASVGWRVSFWFCHRSMQYYGVYSIGSFTVLQVDAAEAIVVIWQPLLSIVIS